MQVATLKECHCNLVGAVQNRALLACVGERLGLWLLLACLAPLLYAPPARAQDALAPAAPVLSGTALPKLAPWQERLTLGPGDTFDLSLFDHPDTRRSAVTIGPDGRINYLQARDVPAVGLTVDELREQLEKALSKYYVAPRVQINPLAYRSKRFYLLGAVLQKGVIPLERPLTVIEAIALGGGFEAAVQQQNVALMVDLERSFLVRRNATNGFARFPVNFEALFQQGDLTQNIPIEPDDYLYFPPQDLQDVYVVGEVRAPGAQPYTKDLTVMAAIAARGGYSEKAWKSRVLVVRGSLTNPQTFAISTSDILAGKAKDFALDGRDIVYVSRKPWAYAQEVLEAGIDSFLYAAVVGYTGQHVGPWISSPIIK